MEFICSWFGALGPSALRYFTVLAMLELRQHAELRRLQGMDPLDDSERAQYRTNCFRASSARIATVMAKATIIRLKMGLKCSTIDSGTASQATPRGRHS